MNLYDLIYFINVIRNNNIKDLKYKVIQFYVDILLFSIRLKDVNVAILSYVSVSVGMVSCFFKSICQSVSLFKME